MPSRRSSAPGVGIIPLKASQFAPEGTIDGAELALKHASDRAFTAPAAVLFSLARNREVTMRRSSETQNLAKLSSPSLLRLISADSVDGALCTEYLERHKILLALARHRTLWCAIYGGDVDRRHKSQRVERCYGSFGAIIVSRLIAPSIQK
jgi:hypothetical protein